MNDTTLYIAGDIGGTNLNLSVATAGPDKPITLYHAQYSSKAETGIGSPLARFVAEFKAHGISGTVKSACLAGAGIVSKGSIAMSNVPWILEASEGETVIDAPIQLVNDFQALVHGIAIQDARDREAFCCLANDKETPPPHSLIAAIGPGTGLGMGFALTGNPPEIYPSEGGNIRFPVWDAESERLRSWMDGRLGRAACAEDWVSGPGIGRSFEFAALDTGKKEGFVQDILATENTLRAPLIASFAAETAICAMVMDRFIEAYAICASDAALTFMPKALFLAGGITAKNIGLLEKNGLFMKRFTMHGKKECRTILETMPVRVVRDYGVSVVGAADMAIRASGGYRF